MVDSARETRTERFQWGASRVMAAWRLLVLGLLISPGAMAANPSPESAAMMRRAAYDEMLRSNASEPVAVQLDAVNRFFNALHYRSDRVAWGGKDHWSTPGELLALGAGDCEDLAIGKYFALRRLGIPVSALRITYTRDVKRNRPHMVLVHRGHDARLQVLDNRSNTVSALAERRELVPIYDFNEGQVAVMAPGGARHSFPRSGRLRIRQWDSLLIRERAVAGTVETPALVRVSRLH